MNTSASIAIIVVAFIMGLTVHAIFNERTESETASSVSQACAKIGKKVEVHKTSSLFTAKCVEP